MMIIQTSLNPWFLGDTCIIDGDLLPLQTSVFTEGVKTARMASNHQPEGISAHRAGKPRWGFKKTLLLQDSSSNSTAKRPCSVSAGPT